VNDHRAAECRCRLNDAAYLLVALSRTQHRRYTWHLVRCARCRAAVEGLRPVAGLLQIDPGPRSRRT